MGQIQPTAACCSLIPFVTVSEGILRFGEQEKSLFEANFIKKFSFEYKLLNLTFSFSTLGTLN
jgi:hypothetical protein